MRPSSLLPFVAALAFASAQAQREAPTASGPIAAPVSIVVYADLECPFSAATLPELEKVASQHPSDVRFDVRQFPLDQHQHAQLAHEAALAAAAQGKYLAMVNLIQANQKLMDRAQFLHYAALLHLNMPQFTRDLDGHRFAARVQEDLAEGRALGIELTPTMFINGKRVDGAQNAADLNELVERSLAATRGPAALPDAGKPLPVEDTTALAVKPTAAMGAADAPVTIVEFTDFQCPFCRRAEDPLHQLLASSHNVRLLYRSYPLDFHEHAELAAEAALAAGDQGKFWPMHDLLFANQGELDRGHFDQFARQLNLDVARFEADLDDGKFRAQVAADRALGQRYGVDGTPFFFINGRPISGARSLVELQQAVQLAMGDNNPASSVVAAAGTRHFISDNAAASGTPVNIDWYIDLEAAASPAIGPIVRQLSTRPDVRVAVHSYALPSHPNAALAYRALMAASAENKFWPLYDALAGKPLPADEAAARAAIQAAAASLHLDAGHIAAAFDDAKLADDLETDRQEAFRRGVRGVPVVFVNNQRVDGIQPEAVYDRYIEQATAKTVALGTKP
jgi:protein-disulfide isomerase